MAGRLDWEKAKKEQRMRVRGYAPTDDLLPRGPHIAKTTSKEKAPTGKPLRKSDALKGRTRGDQSSHDLLHFVADSIAQEQWISEKTPKSVTRALAAKVTKAGGLLAWAQSQPEFEELLKKKKRKKLKREAQNHRNSELPKDTKAESQIFDNKKRKKRSQHLRSEIAEAEEFIRLALKEIARLE